MHAHVPPDPDAVSHAESEGLVFPVGVAMGVAPISVAVLGTDEVEGTAGDG